LARTGGTSAQVRGAGFNCYAVESHAPTQYFLKKLKVAENRRFTVIEGSIFDYRDKVDFDVVLA